LDVTLLRKATRTNIIRGAVKRNSGKVSADRLFSQKSGRTHTEHTAVHIFQTRAEI